MKLAIQISMILASGMTGLYVGMSVGYAIGVRIWG